MAFINYGEKHIALKVVYAGPAGSGKTATLRHVYEHTSDSSMRQGWALSSASDGRHYDYLPMELGEIRGFRTTIDLYTTPSALDRSEERLHLVEAVDGLVFVADCRAEQAAANVPCLHELRGHLVCHDYDLAKLPYVIQLNHSDAPGAASPATVATPLLSWHPDPAAVPVHVSSAQTGQGVFETLKSVSKLCLAALKRGA